MTCEDCRDAIVELARGGHAEAVPALREHLACCGACAGRLEQQRALTAGLRALSAETADHWPSAAVEERVLAAFDAAAEQRATGGDSRRTAGAWRGLPVWLRVAAMLALAAAAGLAWRGLRQPAAGTVLRQTASTRLPAASPTHEAPRPLPGVPQDTTNAGSGPATSAHPQPPRARVVVARGFVPLPWASTLPDFESGEILRVNLPVTALPLYGISVSPDADGSVSADLLVAQDGRPRAIRLVTTQPRR